MSATPTKVGLRVYQALVVSVLMGLHHHRSHADFERKNTAAHFVVPVRNGVVAIWF